jgi:hypothetical protein
MLEGKEDLLLEMMIFMGIKSKPNKSFFNKINHTKDSLTFIHQNIRGLGGKINE